MATDMTQHPYGPGSHAPLADVREMPACYPIKGNVDSMLYHRPDSQNYGATIAEVWFDSPSAAEAAGFALAPRHSKDGVSADYEPGGSGHPCSANDVASNRAAVLGLAAVGGGVSNVHPYGAGSHAPLADVREMPACYSIKGNVDSMLYHRPDSQNYGATVAEMWFDSPSAAEAAGFALAPRHSKDGVSADYEPGGSGHPCTAETVNANRKAIASGAGVAAAGLAPVGGGVSDVYPYGAGSHAPLADVREMPACYPVKGNVDSMLYHRPDSQNYGATIAEVWFDSPSAAEAAGFALAPRHSKDGVSADYEPGGSGHPCAVAAVNANRSAVIGGAALATGGSTTVDGDSSGGIGAGVVAAGAAGVAALAGMAGLAGRDDDTVDVSRLAADADGTVDAVDAEAGAGADADAGAAGVVGGLAGLDARGDSPHSGAAGDVGSDDGDVGSDDGSGAGSALLGGAAVLGAAGAALGGDSAGDVAGGIGSAASGALGGAGDAAMDVGSAASDVVGDAGDVAGSALGTAAAVAAAGGAGAAGMTRGDGDDGDEDDDGAGLAGCLRKWWWLLLLLLGLLLLALLLSQCGGDDDDGVPDTNAAVTDDIDADVNGLNIDGFDVDGFDVDGFDVDGFDVNGLSAGGFDLNGLNADGFDVDGFDLNGFDVNGFDVDGFDVNGLSAGGFDLNGLNADGFDVDGFDLNGLNADGFDVDGFDLNGLNADGFDVNGLDADGFDVDGFDVNGFDVDGLNIDGFDVNGFDLNGFDLNGVSRFDADGFDLNGFDVNGLNADGFDVDGFDVNGFDVNGLNADGESAELQSLANVAEGTSPQVLGLLGPLGLSAALEGDGPFTLFLPSDEGAIAAITANPDLINSVSADPDLATSVLGYHIVPGVISADEIAAGGTFVTSTGLELTVADGAVNGITLTPIALEGTNGVIYVIDGVLLPPANPQLAVTGASLEAMLAMGLAMVFLGGGFVLVGRRREQELV